MTEVVLAKKFVVKAFRTMENTVGINLLDPKIIPYTWTGEKRTFFEGIFLPFAFAIKK